MKKKLILISSKAITINTFLDQLIIDLKKNFKTKIFVSDPKNIILACDKGKIDLSLEVKDFFNLYKIVKYLIKIRFLLEENKDAEIFVHTPLAAHMVRLALIFKKRKIIYFVHGFRFHSKTNFLYYFIFSSIEYLLKNKTKYYFVINKEDKLFVQKKLKKKYYFVNGIGIDLKKNIKKTFSNKIFTIGVVAAYRKNKGYNDLILIAKKLEKDNIKFLCFGYGRKTKYSDKVKELGLRKKVHFSSFKRNLEKYFNKFDLLLHASYREGLPISVLQSLFYNVPVIARDIRGINDLIINKKYGYIIKNNFVNESVGYIKNLLKNKNKIKLLKNNISKIDFRKYSKRQLSKKINIILKKNYEI